MLIINTVNHAQAKVHLIRANDNSRITAPINTIITFLDVQQDHLLTIGEHTWKVCYTMAKIQAP